MITKLPIIGSDAAQLDVPKYNYKHADVRPWDGRNDLYQYERDYTVCTKTRHKTPMIRTQSIVSVLEADKVIGENMVKRSLCTVHFLNILFNQNLWIEVSSFKPQNKLVHYMC